MTHGPLIQAGARTTGADGFGWLRAAFVVRARGRLGHLYQCPTDFERANARHSIRYQAARSQGNMTIERTGNHIHGRIFHSIAEASHYRLYL